MRKQNVQMRDKIIIFIDTVASKNKLQVEAINKCNLQGHFFVYHPDETSSAFLSPNNIQKQLSKNPFRQLFQVFNHVRKHARSIHHLEIYPGSVLSFYYLFVGKLFGLKTICVERGDLTYYFSKKYSLLTRMSMKTCYKYSDILWYREPFMKPLLEKIGVRKLFFLHNAVHIYEGEIIPPSQKSIDFLWLNRIIPERRSDWFVEVLKKDLFKSTKNLLAGILPGGLYQKEQDYVRNNQTVNLMIRNFSSNPKDLFKSSKFFVMPAEFIFANNALLEAMSFGVIPLISDQQGSELIVENGVSGFIFPHTFEGLDEAMERVLKIDDTTLEEMSKAARQKMISDFSEEKYRSRIQEMYKLIEK